MPNKSIFILLFSFIIFSCKTNDPKAKLTLNDDLTKDNYGWQVDFADYPVGQETFYELQTKRASLPAELNLNKMGLMVSGNNHSDDLFMFLKKSVIGLEAETEYTIDFEVDFATNAAEGGFGIGGSPASSVYFGIGASSTEPKKQKNADNFYMMNINKMNQSESGTDMKVIGNISNGLEEYKYKIVKRTGTIKAKTDAKGNIWLIVGTDSGFEGITSLYFTTIKTNLKLSM